MNAKLIGGKRGGTAHSGMTVQEIRDRLVLVGWVGKRRQLDPQLKVVPYFDRGPGLGR